MPRVSRANVPALGPPGWGSPWGPHSAALRNRADKTRVAKVGGVATYDGRRHRDPQVLGVQSRSVRPASRSGGIVAPYDQYRPPCLVCPGFRLDRGLRPCQWCSADGRARAFCLDCGRWLPGCACLLDAGLLRYVE